MTRYPRASSAAFVFLATCVLLASAYDGLRAQGTSVTQRQLLFINEIQLKPETAPEWAELVTAEQIPAQKKSGLTWRDTWANGPGGDPYLRAVVTPVSSLAQFDGPSPMIKSLGEQGAAALSSKTRRLIASSHSTIVTTRPDLGFGAPPTAPKLAILTIVIAVNGRGADFESFLKSEIVPALKKGGATSYSVAQVLFGDDANRYMTLVYADSYAELAKGHPLEKALGPDGLVKVGQKSSAFVSRLERRIIRYVPELSFKSPIPTSD